MPFAELPEYLPAAFVAIEDRRFLVALGHRSAGRGARHRHPTCVATTACTAARRSPSSSPRTCFLTQERTVSRKIQEAILALWLERTYSKAEILELYMNRVYFGAGAYGVEAAARRYFDKSARDVTLSEAAIAGGPRAAALAAGTDAQPRRRPRPRGGRARGHARERGMIDDTALTTALSRPAEPVRPVGGGTANYAADYVMDVLDDFIGTVEDDIVVMTTIDTRLQAAAEQALTANLAEEGERYGVAQGAVVSMRPDGAIVSRWVGGKDYRASQFNRATQAKRQPGSAFKPFVYLAALEAGLTPDTIRIDQPVRIGNWEPENFSRDFRGPVSLREALALSLNTIAAQLASEVGPREVVRTAQPLGHILRRLARPTPRCASARPDRDGRFEAQTAARTAAFANGGEGVISPRHHQSTAAEGPVLLPARRDVGLGRVVSTRAHVAMINRA